MDTRYTLQGIAFEWHEAKAVENIRKHGVSFATACEAFHDPLIRVDEAGAVEGEPREAIIGLTLKWRLLYVAYVMRPTDVIRLISARPATSAERKTYENR